MEKFLELAFLFLSQSIFNLFYSSLTLVFFLLASLSNTVIIIQSRWNSRFWYELWSATVTREVKIWERDYRKKWKRNENRNNLKMENVKLNDDMVMVWQNYRENVNHLLLCNGLYMHKGVLISLYIIITGTWTLVEFVQSNYSYKFRGNFMYFAFNLSYLHW